VSTPVKLRDALESDVNALTTTVYELLADNLPHRAGKQALVDADRAVSYGELSAEVDKIAAYLQAAGVQPGERVIVHLRKAISEVVAMFAVAKVGAVVANVNVQWTSEQLAYVAEDCQARLAVVEARAAKALGREALPGQLTRVLVYSEKGEKPEGATFDAWNDALRGPAGGVTMPRLDTELSMIVYTSGSTGKPKGVMLSHRNIVTGARSVARYLKLSENDRLISILPYSFDYGLNQLTTMMLLGGTVVHQPVSMAAEIVATVQKHEVTGMAAVPPLWNQIVRLLDESKAKLPSLRRVTNSGGKIPKNILERMPHVFPGVDIYLMYGLTEAFRSTYLSPEKFEKKMGSMGRGIPSSEIYVIKHGEGIAGPGETGELVHRGPLVSLGYWGKPEATAEKIRVCPELSHLIGDEKVVYSGDLVRVDEDGDYWFIGRNDMMIKTSGFRLSPDEVEDLVCRSGMVGDAVAFGVDDDDMGQTVHVAITPLADFDEAAVMKHCRKVMAHYMVPRMLHVFREPMPRTASGKLAKPEVIKSCREALAKQAARSDEGATP
jgi:acyl-CoA ligase (AMP-forming) (exosortase A-associated)